MEKKKGLNFFWGIIAIILGTTLFKQFDFKNFKFEKPALDIVYIIGFIISIYFLMKKDNNQPEK
jgi:membrane protein DedA with SNARE-associated domain